MTKTNRVKVLLGLLASMLLSSCAVLHHVQIGEIDARTRYRSQSFSIKVSETGVDLEQAARVTESVTQETELRKVFGIIRLFQLGPSTGYPVYNHDYAENLHEMILEKCPTGRVTGLTIVREARAYPVISGEIVKVDGYCLHPEVSKKKKRSA